MENLTANFATEAVNLLPRPGTTTAVNTPYSYSSGLVLRGTDSPLSRQAIIHELSQGSSSPSEWLEILTLKSGSLAFWDLTDAAGNMIVFLDDPVWDDNPAGTLIVVYSGAFRAPLLPPDDLDPSDGRMIVSSTNPSYFDTTYDNWIPLGNSGDSIFLSDPDLVVVHSLAYGNSVATGTIAAVTAQLSSGNITFNGNDAILLKKGTLVVDSFGQVGVDPGAAWNVGGVTTLDKTLHRKSTITQGETISQSFTLTVTSDSSSTFSTWVGGFPSLGGATGLTDDFDLDGLPNGIKNLLGTAPDLSTPGLPPPPPGLHHHAGLPS